MAMITMTLSRTYRNGISALTRTATSFSSTASSPKQDGVSEDLKPQHMAEDQAQYFTSSCDKKPKTGIIMFNMGGPFTTDEVGKYLHRIMTDRDMIQLPVQSRLGPWIASRRTADVIKKYKEIGGGSPILKWTHKQGQLLVNNLEKELPSFGPFKTYTLFRYVRPMAEETFETILKDSPQNLVIFSQYPQYSCATTGSSLNNIADHFMNNNFQLPKSTKVSVIDRWGSHQLLAKCFAERIQEKLAKFPHDVRDRVLILFSAHSLPLKAVNRGDTYPHEVAATVDRTMQILYNNSNKNISNAYRLVWQSKVGPLPWLQPYTEEAIKSYADKGIKHMIVVPIAFVNEHIETLHELDIEYCMELGEKVGMKQIERATAPNDHPTFISAMTDVISSHLKSGKTLSKQYLNRCPHCTSPRCFTAREFYKHLCCQNETGDVLQA